MTSAQFLLESESNVGELMRSMIGQTGSGEMAGMEGVDMGGDTGAHGGAGAGAGDKGADMRGMPGMSMPGDRK